MTTVSQRIEELRIKEGLNRPALAAALHFPKISIEKTVSYNDLPRKQEFESRITK